MKYFLYLVAITLLISWGGNCINPQSRSLKANNKSNAIYVDSIKKEVTSDSIPSIKIGSQIWMAENLDVTTFRNGDTIHEYLKGPKELNYRKAEWCPCTLNNKKYGKVYNWYATHDKRGLAPKGWHIPSNKEWAILVSYLGANSGIKLKSTTDWGWDSIHHKSLNGTNSSGFNAKPIGYYSSDIMGDTTYQVDYVCGFWTSTRCDTFDITGNWEHYAWVYEIYSDKEDVITRNPTEILYFQRSVRCIKDK